ncbi:hypothetical protein Ddc_22531 [Ditylenchus destructor]|nr:hypothetical protein Ddc_22531 [Ditylenchus destructor]
MSIAYGHFGIPFSPTYAMEETFEAIEAELGFPNSPTILPSDHLNTSKLGDDRSPVSPYVSLPITYRLADRRGGSSQLRRNHPSYQRVQYHSREPGQQHMHSW